VNFKTRLSVTHAANLCMII